MADTRVRCGLIRWDLEVLERLQCQQLDLLSVCLDTIDEPSVTLLARIQCPLKLCINAVRWSTSVPLFRLLAGLPNLIILVVLCPPEASSALWAQCGAVLSYVQRLEVDYYPLPLRDLHLPLGSILSICPALKHLSLHTYNSVSRAEKLHVHARFWHAFKSCANLISLTMHYDYGTHAGCML